MFFLQVEAPTEHQQFAYMKHYQHRTSQKFIVLADSISSLKKHKSKKLK